MRGLLSISLILAGAFLLPGAGIAATVSSIEKDLRKSCPTDHPTISHFDNNIILFDSKVERMLAGPPQNEIKNITYCLQIKGAKHEYVVEWPEHGLKNLNTTSRGYFGFRVSQIQGDVEPKQTSIYIGVNNTAFHPNVFKEIGPIKTLLREAKTIVETILVGSIPKNPNKQDVERYQNLFPVNAIFRARYADGEASLEFVNVEQSQKRSVDFKFPLDLQNNVTELRGTLSVGPDTRAKSYKISGHPVLTRAIITLMNSDRQDVASMPILMFASSER